MNQPCCRALAPALFLLVSAFQALTEGRQATDATLESKIPTLFHDALAADDDTKQVTEAKRIYDQHGLPTVAEVGDEPAYEFVVLLASVHLPSDFRSNVALKLKGAAVRHEIPSDAATFYEVRLRIDAAKKLAESHPPSNPPLRDLIDAMYKSDQAVRQQKGFDSTKMEGVDRQHAAPLQAILDKYGVPTYSMVGPEAAGEFVTMIQHQPARFREEVLPKLKAQVDVGQADPQSYALVYDRSQRDLGKKQFYGEQLECKAGETMQEAPIEDESHVDQRRAELGLIRVGLYAKMVAEEMPQFCSSAQH